MKKLFCALILTFLSSFMLFAFVGCNDNETEVGSNENESEAELPPSELYRLAEAYAKGLITKDDLRNIAYYYNGELATTDFVPLPKNPETLSEQTIKKIQQAYYNKVFDGNSDATVDDVGVGEYYGTYHGCVVVEIGAPCTSDIGGDPLYYPEYVIGDVIFYSYTPLRVWKESNTQETNS